MMQVDARAVGMYARCIFYGKQCTNALLIFYSVSVYTRQRINKAICKRKLKLTKGSTKTSQDQALRGLLTYCLLMSTCLRLFVLVHQSASPASGVSQD